MVLEGTKKVKGKTGRGGQVKKLSKGGGKSKIKTPVGRSGCPIQKLCVRHLALMMSGQMKNGEEARSALW